MKIVLTNKVYEWTIVQSDFAWFVLSSLKQHARGEGKLPPGYEAYERKGKSLSVFQRWDLPEIWIITDRSATTVLFPEER